MAVRGIRGATTTDEDSETAIVDATTELLGQIARENALEPADSAAASQVQAHGCRTHLSDGDERTVIGVIGTNPFALRDLFVEAPGVAEVVPITKPFKLSNREFRSRDTRIRVGAQEVGGDRPWIVAGPCSVDGEELYLETCRKVRAAGAHALRGGVFKPRTSPYSFQGLRGDG